MVSVPSRAQVNHEAIEQVLAGKIKEARASWWGFDPEDSTAALQAAINSGAERVIVEDMGRPWIVRPLHLASNQEVFFEPGVEVLAKQGEFLGGNDSLFRAARCENLFLNGYGATLRMRRDEYAKPPYKKAEWRHVLDIRSSTNVRIYGLTLAESGGDGIYLGTWQPGVTNKNVHIKDCVCDKNYRQGISVITAEDLLIENCILRDTGGTPPQAGIDFEPNEAGERLVNCVMRNCISQGNAGDGYDIYIPALNASSEPVSLRFENCKAIGNHGGGLRIYTGNSPAAAVLGSMEFVDCVFEGCRLSGIEVGNKPVGGCKMRFERCAVLDVATEQPHISPITFLAGQDATEPVGGIELVDCLVRDSLDRKPMNFVDAAGGIGLQQISGRLTVERGEQRTEYELTEQLLGEWMPALAIRHIPRFRMEGVRFVPVMDSSAVRPQAIGVVRQRGMGRWVLWAREGDQVYLRVRFGQVGRYGGEQMPVVVTAADGTEVVQAQVPFQEESEVSFTAPVSGLYSVSANAGINYAQMLSSTQVIGAGGVEAPIHFYATQGELFFWVPAGTREFAVKVFGEGTGEGVRATLVNPDGEAVEEADNAAQVHQFEVVLPEGSPGEAWSIRLAAPSRLVLEDHYVDLRGVPPILAPDRDSLLKPEG